MMKIRLGYSGYNKELNLNSGKALRVTAEKPVSKKAIDRRFFTNIRSIERILGYNLVNNIGCFRINFELIPQYWTFRYSELLEKYETNLQTLGLLINEGSSCISFHAVKSYSLFRMSDMFIQQLYYFANVLNKIKADNSCIIVHVKDDTSLPNAIAQMNLLPQFLINLIALENDQNCSALMAMKLANKIGCRFVYDIFHHKIADTQDFPFTKINVEASINFAKHTWGSKPAKIHISSQADNMLKGAHADYVTWEDYSYLRRILHKVGGSFNIMVEAKANEKAVHQLSLLTSTRNPPWRLNSDDEFAV